MMSTRRLRLFTAALAMGALFTMAACSPSPSPTPGGSEVTDDGPMAQLIADAKAEGTLTVYTAASQGLVDVLMPAFEAEYGIKLNVLRLASGELGQRFLAEAPNSEAAVFEIEHDFFEENADLFVPLDESVIPGYDAYPAGARTAATALDAYLFPWTIVYNTDLVAETEVPDTWEEVAADWSGDYLLSSPLGSSAYMAFANAILEEYGPDVLSELADNKAQYTESAATAAQQIASGEFAMSVPNYAGQVPPLRDQGAPLAFTVPAVPAKALPMSIGLPAGSGEEPSAAARLFVAWRISEAGQQLVCDTEFAGSPLAGDGGLQGCKIDLPPGWELAETVISDERRQEILTLMGL